MSDQHIFHFFLKHVEEQPQKIFIKQGSKSISYLECFKKITQIYDYLDKKNIGKHDAIGVHMGLKYEIILVYFAIIARGGSVIAMSPTLGAYEIKHLLKNSLSKTIIICNEFYEKSLNIATHKIEVLNYDKFKESFSKKTSNTKEIESSMLNLNIHKPTILLTTSGSTGKPKLIVHNLFSMTKWGELYQKIMCISKNSIILQPSPIGYASGILFNIPCATICGATLILPVSTTGLALLNLLSEEKVTHYGGVATISKSILEALKEHPYLRPLFLKFIRLAGEYLSKGFIKELYNSFPDTNIVLTYGATEGFGFLIYNLSSNFNNVEDGMMGRPAFN